MAWFSNCNSEVQVTCSALIAVEMSAVLHADLSKETLDYIYYVTVNLSDEGIRFSEYYIYLNSFL